MSNKIFLSPEEVVKVLKISIDNGTELYGVRLAIEWIESLQDMFDDTTILKKTFEFEICKKDVSKIIWEAISMVRNGDYTSREINVKLKEAILKLK